MSLMERLAPYSHDTGQRPDPSAMAASARAVWRSRARLDDFASVSTQPSVMGINQVIEEDGTVLVCDLYGYVTGVGSTPAEARADFARSLRQQVLYLRTNRLRLHATMLQQLATLERAFPWV